MKFDRSLAIADVIYSENQRQTEMLVKIETSKIETSGKLEKAQNKCA